jgi:hypothetical protein
MLRAALAGGIALALAAAVAAGATSGARAPSPAIYTIGGDGEFIVSGAHPFPGGRAATRLEVAPTDVAVAPDGSILVSTLDGDLLRLGRDGRVEVLHFSPNAGSISGLAVAADGSVLMADGGERVTRRLPDGRIVPAAGNGAEGPDGASLSGGDGLPATKASLDGPVSVAALADGGYLVAELGGDKIRRVRPDGVIETAAGIGQRGFGGDGGPAIRARLRLHDPFDDSEDVSGDVAALPDGGFLVADTGNHRIRRVAPDGTITTVAGDGGGGSGTAGYSGDGGPATAASIGNPSAVAAEPGGGFVFAEPSEAVIRRVSRAGIISTVAGTAGVSAPIGLGVAVGDGGPPRSALIAPWGRGLATTPGGGLVFTDFSRVRLIPGAGAPATIAVTGMDGRGALTYRASLPGRVIITLRTRRHRPVSLHARATGGFDAVRLPRRAPPGVYAVAARLDTPQGTAYALAGLVAGAALPVDAAREAFRHELADDMAVFGEESDVGRCRRFGATRVDCIGTTPNGRSQRCVRVGAATLRRGAVFVRPYSCFRRRRDALFERRPRWVGPALPEPVIGRVQAPVG